MRSLSWKFGAALLLVAVVSLGLMSFLIYLGTTRQFENYINQTNDRYAKEVVDKVGRFYSEAGGWSDIQSRLDYFPIPKQSRLIIADNSGVIVGDTADEWIGKKLDETDLDDGTPITVYNDTVGELYLVSTEPLSDIGPPMGLPGRPPPQMQLAERNFLHSAFISLWIASAVSIIIAVLLGLFLTRQITRPVQALKEGTHRIAEGELSYRVKVSSKDEIGEMAQSFNKMASNLDMVEQSRRRINADIAHELRTPLTVIRGTVDGIIDGVLEADLEHLNSIKEQTTLLTRLTQDIRDISLIESGQLNLEPSPTDIVDLIKRKVAQSETKVREKNIRIELKTSGEIPEISVDPMRIEQVVANLLANALQYTPSSGTVTIAVDTVTEDSDHFIDKPSLVISFTDTGKGIEPDSLPYVFDRFYRADDSRSRADGGTGLGLAIVKQMVEAHGGQVWAGSEPGKGSTFYISFPLQDY